MKVLQISSARSIGGGEKHVIDLSNELAKRGHAVFVAVVPGSPLVRMLSDVPPANVREYALRNALDLPTAIRIANFAREKKVELINAHVAKDYPVAAVAARLARVPFVITRHVLFPMNGLHRVLLRNVQFVIAPSNAGAESLRQQGLFPDEKIVTIRYGLDVNSFPERVRESQPRFCVGSIGNLDPVKGFDILIGAAAIVSKSKPDVKFKIVGADRSRDGRNEKDLRDLIERLGVGNTVELAGWSDDVRGVLAGFDIFVSASRSESFGFVIAEAMLSRIPVIATETAGAKEIISNPTFGQLVSVGSAESLATAILELVADPARRELITDSGRDHIRQNFSLARTVEETERLYVRVIGG